jgi:hypothetical protein
MRQIAPDQHLPADYQTFFSSNVADSEVCFRHGPRTHGFAPVFHCESCGFTFCPVCTTGVWREDEVGKHRYFWYRCPNCPIGLAFIALPLVEPVLQEDATRPRPRPVRVTMDPVLRGTRPGTYRVLFPTVQQHGFYHAFWNPMGPSLLGLDGLEWVSWLQHADSAELSVVPTPAELPPLPVDEGEYLLALPPHDPGEDVSHLTLFLELPQGYQEYELPEGWPEGRASRPLQITDRIWNHDELMQVLPALSRAAQQGGAPAEQIPVDYGSCQSDIRRPRDAVEYRVLSTAS